MSKEFEGQTDLVEPWYKTAYSVEDITDSMIQVCPLLLFVKSFILFHDKSAKAMSSECT